MLDAMVSVSMSVSGGTVDAETAEQVKESVVAMTSSSVDEFTAREQGLVKSVAEGLLASGGSEAGESVLELVGVLEGAATSSEVSLGVGPVSSRRRLSGGVSRSDVGDLVRGVVGASAASLSEGDPSSVMESSVVSVRLWPLLVLRLVFFIRACLLWFLLLHR